MHRQSPEWIYIVKQLVNPNSNKSAADNTVPTTYNPSRAKDRPKEDDIGHGGNNLEEPNDGNEEHDDREKKPSECLLILYRSWPSHECQPAFTDGRFRSFPTVSCGGLPTTSPCLPCVDTVFPRSLDAFLTWTSLSPLLRPALSPPYPYGLTLSLPNLAPRWPGLPS